MTRVSGLTRLARVGNGYPPGAAVAETQRSGGSVDDEHPVLGAAEHEVAHRGPVVFLAVPLAELQRRCEQAPLRAGQVQVLTGERQPVADLAV